MGGMIPLSDASRQTKVTPVATVFIIVLNVAVFAMELAGGDAFVIRWAVNPAQIVHGHRLITLLTGMFLHGGWMHIIGNMIFLWAFGPEIEDSMGRLRYLCFYLLGGFVGFVAQIAMMPNSTIPSLGASGAIAAVMGAFIVTYPTDRIKTLMFFGWFYRTTFIPAVLLIGLWFVVQLFNQVGAVGEADTGGVAYAAHVGGFIFGAVFGRLFETARTAEFES